MHTLQKAKILRHNPTAAEQKLWYYLRAHRFMGLKFKRQQPMGYYIVDFVCIEHKLIIELDGSHHQQQIEYDQQRTDWLNSQDYRVMRFWNHDVLQQIEVVLDRIRLEITLSPALSLGERGQNAP